MKTKKNILLIITIVFEALFVTALLDVVVFSNKETFEMKVFLSICAIINFFFWIKVVKKLIWSVL